ncbi:hypothetical protein BLOT_012108 [Blomia tropicalis]|nr:hypothetical protein BLOT_012108 [Blomia tropicalis]
MTNQCNYPHHATASPSPSCNSITITIVQQHHHPYHATASPSPSCNSITISPTRRYAIARSGEFNVVSSKSNRSSQSIQQSPNGIRKSMPLSIKHDGSMFIISIFWRKEKNVV